MTKACATHSGPWLAVAVLSLSTLSAEGAEPRSTALRVDDRTEAAIERGVQFLLRDQNADGSWGSPRNTKGLNIYAPVPGAHDGFLAADTALCIAALIELQDDRKEVVEAIDRAELWLERKLPEVRRATPDAIYNVWAHAYAIQGLVRMIRRHADDSERVTRLKALIEEQIDRLSRYESVDGGWGYYDFDVGSKQPTATTTSFTTATVLVALYEAKEAGVAVPDRLVQRALTTVRRQQKPDFSYVYSESHKYKPMYEINRPGGSLGRSQACNLALRLWGDDRITDTVLRTWLDRLFARNLWLDIGRKRPVPHESWFLVAGYFYYYGHYYAALCMDLLDPAAQSEYARLLANVLVPLQEKDGSWWDYPFYDYHQQYGTAFALMALHRTRR